MTQGEIAALLAGLGDEEVEALIETLTPAEAAAVLRDWRFWARPEQLPPAGEWSTWVIMAGRGFGKTRAGAEWIAELVRSTANLRIALVGATYADARAVMVEGESGLCAVAGPLIKAIYPSRRLITFHNGSEARLYSGASPEELRGPQHHVAWCDELAKWKRAEASWAMLQMGLRLGRRPRALVTTTPRWGTILEALLAAPGTVMTGGATHANPHLPASFRDAMERQYGGTQQGQQEIEGKLVSDAPGALWTAALITRTRAHAPPQLARVAIGVDPPSGTGTCGIVACGVDADGCGHVLADHSITATTPEGWAARVAEAAALHGPRSAEGRALVVAERNQGGEMVRSVLLGAAPDLHIRMVTASQGKSHRAEPIALRFEAGRAFFHGRFPPLEAQLMGLIAGGGYEGPGNSPDRADAMVWALTELLLGPRRGAPAVSGLYVLRIGTKFAICSLVLRPLDQLGEALMTNLAIPTRALGLAMACLSSVAVSAQTTPSAPAPAAGPAAAAPAVGAIIPGMAVVDPAGAAVGTVSSVNGDQLVIKTDKHEVQLPATSFTADKGKLLFALTQAQLNTQVEQALAEANAKLVVGTNVYGAGGTQAGTITQIDDKFLTMKLTSGKLVRLPRTAIAPSANGAVLGMSAAELQMLAEQAK